MPNKLVSPLIVAIALAGCSKGPAANDATTSTAAQARDLLAGILKQVAVDLDACFAGAPAMRAPGTPQTAPGIAPRAVGMNRLIVAIDSSGSMAAQVGGTPKLEAAKRAATAFLNSVPSGTQVGLVVFGHKGSSAKSGKAASCAGVETLYPLGQANAGQIAAAMTRFRATGWTPLASAITTAGAGFSPDDTTGRQVVYVVSDGIETCGGDPVAAARALNAGPVKAIVNIIGFDLRAADRAQLKAVADAGGGTFVETRPSEIGRMLDDLQRKAGAVSAITRERFDAGGRTTDNNMAAGRYTIKVNMCLYHGADDETKRVTDALSRQGVAPDLREAALALLRQRHESYRNRATRVAADLDTQRQQANTAIDAQTSASENRLDGETR